MTFQRDNKGFTLIEIIVVLGIAALVMGAVFVAAAGAQQNSRDTKRKADATYLAKAIEQWSSNHNGALPTSSDGPGNDFDSLNATDGDSLIGGNYLDVGKFTDPKTGAVYTINDTATVPSSCTNGTKLGNMYYWTNSTDANSYTIQVCLETGDYKYTP